MRIACHRGWSLRECYDRIDSVELTVWLAYYQMEGWPDVRADYRAAFCAWAAASANGARVKLNDFIPKFDTPPANDWRIMQAQLIALAEQRKREQQHNCPS